MKKFNLESGNRTLGAGAKSMLMLAARTRSVAVQHVPADTLVSVGLRRKPFFRLALALGLVLAWVLPLGVQANDVRLAAVDASAASSADEADQPEDAAPAAAADSAVAPASASNRRPALRVGTLDGRVQLLAKELGLSPAQQGQVKKVLLAQRQQVAALWSDSAVPAALRVSRTQAIGDRTADQIRALLTDVQREKYIKPRVRDTSVGSVGANVESWKPQGRGQ